MTMPIAVPHMDPSDAPRAVAEAVDHAVSRLADATPTHVPNAGIAGLGLSPSMAVPPLLNADMVRSLLLRALPEMLAFIVRRYLPGVRQSLAGLHSRLVDAGLDPEDITVLLGPIKDLMAALETGDPS